MVSYGVIDTSWMRPVQSQEARPVRGAAPIEGLPVSLVSKCCKSATWACGSLLTAVGSAWGVPWMLPVFGLMDMTGAVGRFT